MQAINIIAPLCRDQPTRYAGNDPDQSSCAFSPGQGPCARYGRAALRQDSKYQLDLGYMSAKPEGSRTPLPKAGLGGMTRTLAVELAPYNVLVNAIAPGFVNTEMTRRNNTEGANRGDREEHPCGQAWRSLKRSPKRPPFLPRKRIPISRGRRYWSTGGLHVSDYHQIEYPGLHGKLPGIVRLPGRPRKTAGAVLRNRRKRMASLFGRAAQRPAPARTLSCSPSRRS